MKFSNLVFALFAVVIIGVAVFLATPTSETAAATNDEISRYCQQSQNYLRTTIRQRDLRARVDRLQTYRYIAGRLDIFTKRLEQHSQPRAQTMRSLTTQFTRQVDDFKFRYESYDRARDELGEMSNCDQSPHTFNKYLSTARSRLKSVEQSIKNIDNMLTDDIPGDLQTLQTSLETTEEATR